jgi:hypothetical protein
MWGSYFVADCDGKGDIGRQEESRANARLISAAPDLLNALLKFPQHHGATDQDWWDWIGIAREAIDKAQGEA